MGARTLGALPQARLMHHQGTAPAGGGIVRSYVASPLSTPRPQTGSAEATVRCLACHGLVRLRVRSEGDARRWRALWAALAIAGAVVLAALVAFGSDGQALGDALGAGGVVLGIVGGITALVGGAWRWFREDGVTILDAPEPPPAIAAFGGEHLIGYPTVGSSTWTKRGRARSR